MRTDQYNNKDTLNKAKKEKSNLSSSDSPCLMTVFYRPDCPREGGGRACDSTFNLCFAMLSVYLYYYVWKGRYIFFKQI